MDVTGALDVAGKETDAIDIMREALDVLADEVRRLQAEVERSRALKTLGGIPPETDKEWANVTLAPPESASNPRAAPVGGPGMVSSAQYYSKEK